MDMKKIGSFIAVIGSLYFLVSMTTGKLLVGIEEWKMYYQDQGGAIMKDLFMYTFWVVIIVGVLAITEFAFAVYYKLQEKKMLRMDGIALGKITGLLRSHLFKNDIHGEIPGGAIIGWGVAQGEQSWGGTLKFRVPPWFPCVKFEVNGVEYQKITGEGVWKDTWEIGQNVTIIYKSDAPGICIIEGDPSYRNKMKLCILNGLVFSVICIVGIVVMVVLL